MIGVTQLLSKPLVVPPIVNAAPDPLNETDFKSHYSFNNTFNDSSSNSYHGTGNSASFVETGKFGSHYYATDGTSSDIVSLPNLFNQNGTFTAWLYIPDDGTAKEWYIFSKTLSAYRFLSFELSRDATGLKAAAFARGITTSNYRYTSEYVNFPVNEWFHIGYYFNNSGVHAISVNGGSWNSLTSTLSNGSVPPIDTSPAMVIGRRYINGVAYYAAPFYIDEIRTYSSILTSSQMSTLANE